MDPVTTTTLIPTLVRYFYSCLNEYAKVECDDGWVRMEKPGFTGFIVSIKQPTHSDNSEMADGSRLSIDLYCCRTLDIAQMVCDLERITPFSTTTYDHFRSSAATPTPIPSSIKKSEALTL